MENTLKRAIDQYGPKMQQVIAIEELSELQKEITKTLRGDGNRSHMIEEIVDVKIMLEQLILINEITCLELNEMMSVKIARLMRRLEAE